MGSQPVSGTATDKKGEALRLLAQDIRALRKAHGLTLSGLAERLDRSVGWLSQVERGISLPSLADLRALAQQFKVPVSLFLSEEPANDREDGLIVRADRRRMLSAKEDGIVEELLSPNLGGGFAMLRAEFAPGAGIAEPRRGAKEEAGHLLTGMIEVEIGGVWHSLAPGDSFQFRNQAVRWRNSGAEPAIVVRVVSPPVY